MVAEESTHKRENGSGSSFSLLFSLKKQLPNLGVLTVVVPAAIVRALYREASLAQRAVTEAPGFAKGTVPLDYIQKSFKSTLLEHVEEFLLKYTVLDFVYKEIRQRKIFIAGPPRLIDISISPDEDARFIFEVSLVPTPPLQEWKYLAFRAPKRKNYKDLDRQVASFIQKEKDALTSHTRTTIEVGDWVNFSIQLINTDNVTVLGKHKAYFWLKIGDEEADSSFRSLFCGKKKGAILTTQNQALQEYFGESIDTAYTFTIEIIDVVSHAFFCLDKFKKQFKIKTNKALYQKFVEVFSYRNDISQRRSMVQEALYLLLSKYPFQVPSHCVLRQQKEILELIQEKPDYHVYRTQKDFNESVQKLAQKLIQEKLFLDNLAYNEKIAINDQDIHQYLNLTNRPRIKEFIYFDPPATKFQGQEVPVPAEEIKIYCLREKTINYIIYHLTKK